MKYKNHIQLSFFKNSITKKALTKLDTQGVTSSNLVSPTKDVEVVLSEPINIELIPISSFIGNKYSEGIRNHMDFVSLSCHFFQDSCHICDKTREVSSIRQNTCSTSRGLWVQIPHFPPFIFFIYFAYFPKSVQTPSLYSLCWIYLMV